MKHVKLYTMFEETFDDFGVNFFCFVLIYQLGISSAGGAYHVHDFGSDFLLCPFGDYHSVRRETRRRSGDEPLSRIKVSSSVN